jgi:type III secretion system (T3SS) SseB-like protein
MQTEENALELALMLAASEPAHRPEFFRLLLESTVFVLGSSGQLEDHLSEGPITLKADTQVQIQNWVRPDGSAVIPFFSSLRALQLAIQTDERYIALPARTFLAMTRGAELILNSGSEYGKEFTAAEVEALLSAGVNRVPEQRVVERDTEVLLGQPSNYPTQMADSLATLLAKHINVKAAYLALIHDRSANEEPHLIVGIEAEGDIENVIREAGTVAGDTAPDGEPVDLVRVIRGKPGMAEYFIKEVKPFYERD